VNKSEAERVLANWIAEANSPLGKLPAGESPEAWAARKFLTWWQEETSQYLQQMESSLECLKAELERLGGWSNPELGEALHELTHILDSVGDLKRTLGFYDKSQ
jgi:hypothetical protein